MFIGLDSKLNGRRKSELSFWWAACGTVSALQQGTTCRSCAITDHQHNMMKNFYWPDAALTNILVWITDFLYTGGFMEGAAKAKQHTVSTLKSPSSRASILMWDHLETEHLNGTSISGLNPLKDILPYSRSSHGIKLLSSIIKLLHETQTQHFVKQCTIK